MILSSLKASVSRGQQEEKLTCGTRRDRDAIARRGRGRLLRVFPSVGRKKR